MEKQYKYKGHIYDIISEGQLKNPVTREWENCVIYSREIEGKTRIFVREKTEFLSRFSKINK